MNKRIIKKLLKKQEDKELMKLITIELVHNAFNNNFVFNKETYKRFLTNNNFAGGKNGLLQSRKNKENYWNY